PAVCESQATALAGPARRPGHRRSHADRRARYSASRLVPDRPRTAAPGGGIGAPATAGVVALPGLQPTSRDPAGARAPMGELPQLPYPCAPHPDALPLWGARSYEHVYPGMDLGTRRSALYP